jgi:hypothetical protein
MRATQRLAAGLVLCGLASAACGARLDAAQRQEALSYGRGGGGSSTGTGTGTAGDGSTTGAGTTGVVGPGTTTGTTGVVGPGTSGPVSTTGGPGTTGTSGVATTDFTKAPAGGNGGSTDVGVTADTITVANISDVSGAVPGLFEDARFAVQAYFKYFGARYGTLYGRKVKVLALDSQLDSGANRSASIQACSEAFAGVGSISAFDQGGAPIIKNCKSKGGVFPDLRGLSTTEQMRVVPNAFPMQASGAGRYKNLGQYGWVAEQHASAIKKAVMVYSDGEVTRQNAGQDIEGTTKIFGYKWLKEIPVATTETNYGPVAQQVKSLGGQFVTFIGAYQQAASLARAMQSLNYKPEVFQPTVTAYTPNFINQAGPAVTGGNVYISLVTAVVEEAASNPELALYSQWLQQVKPGARPTTLGQFAWGAAALWVEQMIKVGPRPTRGKLIDLIEKVPYYAPNNMYPAQDIAKGRGTSCSVIVRVTESGFVRHTPAAGYRCQDGVFDLQAKRRIPGYPK